MNGQEIPEEFKRITSETGVGVTRNCTPVVTEDDVRYEWEAGG